MHIQDIKIPLEKLKTSTNLTELLDENELAYIASTVVDGYEIDEDSRAEWKDTVDKAMEIAKQVTKKKNFPWSGASNIKMPIITRACIDYASRTLPEVIQNDKVVKCSVIGEEYVPASQEEVEDVAKKNKFKRASRVSKFMSYQLLHKSPDWENSLDSLLQTLPVVGTVFKKTYYSEVEKRVVSEMCIPARIVVNYNVTSLETARRVTHVLEMYTNDIIERQRRGIFNEDVDVEGLRDTPVESLEYSATSIDDQDMPVEILEQHCYFDLDGDGYKEPYVVLVHKESRQVLRIVQRFKKIESVKGEVVRIVPEHYFTDFHFIKSPDGGFYSMGFGSLLLPSNLAINTLINQLIDAGTLSNTQGGFLGRGLRLKNGEFKMKMGEWKVLDAASGTKISDNVFPMPTKEPSQTLFQLLGLMIQIAQDLSSTSDVLTGKQPAQNVSSGTISQLVEQGTKVFTAVNKRVYRGLKKEYQKIFELNSTHLTQKEYQTVLEDPLANVKLDFEQESLDIIPVADPTLSSEQQRIQRLMMIQQLPTVDRRAIDEMTLDTLQIDSAQKARLLPQPDPNAPPPPEQQKIMMEMQKMQAEIAKISAETTLQAEKVAMEKIKLEQDMRESTARIEEAMNRIIKMQEDAAVNKAKIFNTSRKIDSEKELKELKTAMDIDSAQHEKAVKDVELVHQMDMDKKEKNSKEE